MENKACGCILERTAAEMKTANAKIEDLTDPNGDFISKGALIAEIEDAMHWGTCHGLADVLEIIKDAPAVAKPPEKEMDWVTAVRYLMGKCESVKRCKLCEIEEWCTKNGIRDGLFYPEYWVIPERD